MSSVLTEQGACRAPISKLWRLKRNPGTICASKFVAYHAHHFVVMMKTFKPQGTGTQRCLCDLTTPMFPIEDKKTFLTTSCKSGCFWKSGSRHRCDSKSTNFFQIHFISWKTSDHIYKLLVKMNVGITSSQCSLSAASPKLHTLIISGSFIT